MDNTVDVELVRIGDVEYPKDQVTPSAYFEYVKGKKQNLDSEEQEKYIDSCLAMLKKFKITGQTSLARDVVNKFDIATKELHAAKEGFNVYVYRTDIELYIENIAANTVKVTEMKNFPREIPEEVIDKIIEAKEIFDEIYIVFTDYTGKEEKKVAKERRDKDPIAFGAFFDPNYDTKNPVPCERLFYICDWIDDKCDLTLDLILKAYEKKENAPMKYMVPDMPQTTEELKEYFGLIEKKDPEKGIRIVEKIKKAVTKKSPRGRKKKSDE